MAKVMWAPGGQRGFALPTITHSGPALACLLGYFRKHSHERGFTVWGLNVSINSCLSLDVRAINRPLHTVATSHHTGPVIKLALLALFHKSESSFCCLTKKWFHLLTATAFLLFPVLPVQKTALYTTQRHEANFFHLPSYRTLSHPHNSIIWSICLEWITHFLRVQEEIKSVLSFLEDKKRRKRHEEFTFPQLVTVSSTGFELHRYLSISHRSHEAMNSEALNEQIYNVFDCFKNVKMSKWVLSVLHCW